MLREPASKLGTSHANQQGSLTVMKTISTINSISYGYFVIEIFEQLALLIIDLIRIDMGLIIRYPLQEFISGQKGTVYLWTTHQE